VRLFDRLFSEAYMDNIPQGTDYKEFVNSDSLKIVTALIEPALAAESATFPVQFERLGYFIADSDDTPEHRVFNRTVTLKDTWSKVGGKHNT